MKKENLSFLLVLVVLFSILTFNNAYANSNDIKIKVNNEFIYPDVAPFINEEGRTYVPVRFIAEKLGLIPEFSVDFDGNTQINNLILLNKEKNIEVSIDSWNHMLIDGIRFMPNSETLIIKNNRSFVPLRALAYALHMNINWDATTKTIELNNNNEETTYSLLFDLNHDENNYKEDIDYNAIDPDTRRTAWKNQDLSRLKSLMEQREIINLSKEFKLSVTNKFDLSTGQFIKENININTEKLSKPVEYENGMRKASFDIIYKNHHYYINNNSNSSKTIENILLRNSKKENVQPSEENLFNLGFFYMNADGTKIIGMNAE